jgi:hypothetical protein
MARSTMSMARSTPAQNPRGLANKFASGIFAAFGFEQRIQQQTRRADRDRRIRDVECRKIRPIPVEVDEIDDMPQANPVDDVAQAPPSTNARPPPAAMRAARQSHNQVMIAELTTTASPMNSQRCQPDADARKLNAAPTLCIRVMSRTGSTLMNSNSPKCRVCNPC